MQQFVSDYMEGAHPKILEKLLETNMEKTDGYGLDPYSESAREKIRKAVGAPEAEIYFLAGGTQTNETVISSVLRPYEGVIAANTGHVNTHEAGAIEHGGHKVLTIAGEEGRLSAEKIRLWAEKFLSDANHEHEVAPGMVYISHPTEYGTLYTKEELTKIREVCLHYGMKLFLDGARLGYGLAAEGTDLSLKDIAALTDVFYIGGTKVGALFGEAVVFPKPGLVPHFYTITKQHGARIFYRCPCHFSHIGKEEAADGSNQESVKGNGKGMVSLFQRIAAENRVQSIAKPCSQPHADSRC